MNKNQEKIKAALERIDQGLATINTNEDWLNYLCFQSKFYSYSYSNAILIYSQNPEASYVKGYKAWNQLGRYVKKGAKGLAILAPCFKKVDVFKEPENKCEYHDAEGEKETKTIISGFKVTYVYDIADIPKMTEEIADSDIFVNATIVGMKPMDNESVVKDLSAFRPGLVVADAVYNPIETKLLREAKEAGCTCVGGKGMLLWQGVAAFKLYTGMDMPVDEVKAQFFS